MVHIGNSWDNLLAEEFQKEYYLELREFLKKEYATQTVYPPADEIFFALTLTDYRDVKVVILGQDPYHEPGEAHGLAFSVRPNIPIPPSLRNIFEELRNDMDLERPTHGYLFRWAKQGVLLLNTCLTVRAHKPNSHHGKGWEIFTDRIISLLGEREEPIVFILWGANARAKRSLIHSDKHLILEAPHPSPLSAYRGFFGGRYFSRVNEFLEEPIDWRLDEDQRYLVPRK